MDWNCLRVEWYFVELKLKAMKIICIIAASIALICISCQGNVEDNPKKAFDKELWKVKDIRGNYSFRDEMLDSLVYKEKLKGLTKEEVIKMLGQPSRTNKGHLYYEISNDAGVLPFHKKFLVLKLAENGTVEWRKIYE